MISIRHYMKLFSIILSVAMWLAACSSTSYINVTYGLPAASERLKSKAIFLKFEDARIEKDFLTKAARKEFKYFTGIFSLTLTGGKTDNLIGSFDAESLFKEAFSRRLNALGIDITPVRLENQPTMEIVLKEFLLDLKGRKWVARIGFETRLIQNTGHMASETVSAEGERYKTLGRGSAEMILGEIFTDSLNKTDIAKLFQKIEQ